jgi:integrase
VKRPNGEGSITYDRKRKRWRARVTVPTADGPKRKTLGWRKTRDEAHAMLVEALSRDGRRRLAMDADRTTLEDYLTDWLENTARLNVSDGIYRQYVSQMKRHVIPYIGTVKLGELRSAHIRIVKQELLDRGLAHSTASFILGTLSTALNQAVADELIPSNPARSVRKPKAKKPPMRVLDEAQTARLIEHVRGTRYEAFYLVAVVLGLRQGELAGLFWQDVDLKRRLLFVRRSVSTDRAGEVWNTTKSGDEREILMPETVCGALKRHRKLQAEEVLAAPSWKDPDLVFPNRRGGVGRRASVYENFQRHREQAALPEMRFHDLRDTAATLMVRHGIDIRTVADILGHADPAMTLRRYAHVLPSMRERAAGVMDSYGF